MPNGNGRSVPRSRNVVPQSGITSVIGWISDGAGPARSAARRRWAAARRHPLPLSRRVGNAEHHQSAPTWRRTGDRHATHAVSRSLAGHVGDDLLPQSRRMRYEDDDDTSTRFPHRQPPSPFPSASVVPARVTQPWRDPQTSHGAEHLHLIRPRSSMRICADIIQYTSRGDAEVQLGSDRSALHAGNRARRATPRLAFAVSGLARWHAGGGRLVRIDFNGARRQRSSCASSAAHVRSLRLPPLG